MRGLDTSNELLLYRFGQGIKLIRPDRTNAHKKLLHFGYNTHYTVGSLLEFPFCVYFGNTDSESINLNEAMVELAGFDSRHYAIGKTLRAVYSRKTADQINKNNIAIMKNNQIHIIDEEATRLLDDQFLSGISIKIPWYDDDHKVIGLFGFSIALGIHSFANALSSIAKLGLLNLESQAKIVPGLQINDVYLSKREAQCLQLTIRGQSAKQIGYTLQISRRTVEEYLNNIKLKLGVFSKAELIEKVMNFLMPNDYD